MQFKPSKILIFVLLLVIVSGNLFVFANAQEVVAYAQSTPYYSGDYYNGVNDNLKGFSMYDELSNLITSTHKKYTSYSGLADAFKSADADPNNSGNVIWFYTGTSVSFKSFSGSGGGTNREHVWPKDGGDAFPAESGPGSDAHHLRPTECNLNSTRGSKSFDEVSQSTGNIVKQNGSTSYGTSNNPDSYCYTSGNFFYPAEGYRGATARILLYMYVRWGTQYNLQFVDSAGSSKTIGKISTLLKWHYEEAPSQAEMRRNDAVYQIQGNRNPFIDHPEWATTIICDTNQSYSANCKTIADTYNTYDQNGGGGGVELEYIEPSSYLLTMTPGQKQTLTVTAYPSGSSNAVTFSSSDTSVATVDENGAVTAKNGGEAQITITSKVNSDVKTYVRVEVKTASAIQITGTPNKATYSAGQTFDPTGLVVNATYDDGTSQTLSLTDCQWLDVTTQSTILSKDATSVICKYGNLTAIVEGITVGESQTKTVTIDRSSFTNATGNYAWYDWGDSSVGGKAYSYLPESATRLQFNNSKNSCYLYGATTGAISSVTVYLDSGKNQWELVTNSSAYDNTAGKYPTLGTSHGTKSVTTTGVTWDLTGNTHCYFSLNYRGDGASYLAKIEITYGGEGGQTTPPQQNNVTLDKSSATLEQGQTLTLSATASDDVIWISSNNGVATVNNGVVTAIGEGVATITAICGNATAECVVTVNAKPCTNHQESGWIVDKDATCTATGTKHTICLDCGITLNTQTIDKKDHVAGSWVVDKDSTCTASGSKHNSCIYCNQPMQTQTIPATGHTFGDWVVTTQPTTTIEGQKTHSCSNCGYSETQTMDKLLDKTQFEQAVNNAINAQTLKQKFDAITVALNAYDSFDENQKSQVATLYQQLQEQVIDYNNIIAQQNQQSNSVLTVIAQSLSAISLSVTAFAILSIFKKRY